MALKLIKNKIKATQRTGKVTKAMEAVSAVKMRKSQEKALKGRPYAEAALRVLENISQSNDAIQHAYLQPDVGTHDCVIVITSDKGLAGSLNSAVLKEATLFLQSKQQSEIEIICFGRKAYEHFSRRGYTVPKHFINMSDEVQISDMEEVVHFITTRFKEGVYKNVWVIYQNFVTTFEQRALMRQVLPIKTEEVRTMITDILPKHGRYSVEQKPAARVAYTIEAADEKIFETLFNSLVEIMLYHALLESKASEHSARMVAMKNATDKAKEVSKFLTLKFNKERQSVITREVSEITGGIEAMRST